MNYLEFWIIVCVAFTAFLGAVIWQLIHMTCLTFFGCPHFYKAAAKELGILPIEAQKRFERILATLKEKCYENAPGPVLFSTVYFRVMQKELGACFSKRKRCVHFSPYWIYLVLTDEDTWLPAFITSVGHEMEHEDDVECSFWAWLFKWDSEARLRKWANEVRCDFQGREFARNFYPAIPEEQLMDGIRAKAKEYDARKKSKNKASFSHPAWDVRIALLEKHNHFGYEVVNELATVAGCDNHNLIYHLANETTKPF